MYTEVFFNLFININTSEESFLVAQSLDIHSIFKINSYMEKFCMVLMHNLGFPGGSVVNNPSAKARDVGLILGWGRSPGEGNDNPLQYSCLENPVENLGRLESMGSQRAGHD